MRSSFKKESRGLVRTMRNFFFFFVFFTLIFMYLHFVNIFQNFIYKLKGLTFQEFA